MTVTISSPAWAQHGTVLHYFVDPASSPRPTPPARR